MKDAPEVNTDAPLPRHPCHDTPAATNQHKPAQAGINLYIIVLSLPIDRTLAIPHWQQPAAQLSSAHSSAGVGRNLSPGNAASSVVSGSCQMVHVTAPHQVAPDHRTSPQSGHPERPQLLLRQLQRCPYQFQGAAGSPWPPARKCGHKGVVMRVSLPIPKAWVKTGVGGWVVALYIPSPHLPCH